MFLENLEGPIGESANRRATEGLAVSTLEMIVCATAESGVADFRLQRFEGGLWWVGASVALGAPLRTFNISPNRHIKGALRAAHNVGANLGGNLNIGATGPTLTEHWGECWWFLSTGVSQTYSLLKRVPLKRAEQAIE
jgi:hypothetical protein